MRLTPDEIIVGVSWRPRGSHRAALTLPKPNRHGDIIRDAVAAGVNLGHGPYDQGFITSTGRVVDRQDAALIAREAGQLIREPTPSDNLTSEDVW